MQSFVYTVGSDKWKSPRTQGSGQIVCLSSLLLFNYKAVKRRGYLPTIPLLQEEISTVPFIMQSAVKSGTDKI